MIYCDLLVFAANSDLIFAERNFKIIFIYTRKFGCDQYFFIGLAHVNPRPLRANNVWC